MGPRGNALDVENMLTRFDSDRNGFCLWNLGQKGLETDAAIVLCNFLFKGIYDRTNNHMPKKQTISEESM